MGNILRRPPVRPVVPSDPLYEKCAPTSLYKSCKWSQLEVYQHIKDNKLALRIEGVEDERYLECIICFLNYPNLNQFGCCKQYICTECYLQLIPPPSAGTEVAKATCCPYCTQNDIVVDPVSSSPSPVVTSDSNAEPVRADSSGISGSDPHTEKDTLVDTPKSNSNLKSSRVKTPVPDSTVAQAPGENPETSPSEHHPTSLPLPQTDTKPKVSPTSSSTSSVIISPILETPESDSNQVADFLEPSEEDIYSILNAEIQGGKSLIRPKSSLARSSQDNYKAPDQAIFVKPRELVASSSTSGISNSSRSATSAPSFSFLQFEHGSGSRLSRSTSNTSFLRLARFIDANPSVFAEFDPLLVQRMKSKKLTPDDIMLIEAIRQSLGDTSPQAQLTKPKPSGP